MIQSFKPTCVYVLSLLYEWTFVHKKHQSAIEHFNLPCFDYNAAVSRRLNTSERLKNNTRQQFPVKWFLIYVSALNLVLSEMTVFF